MHADHLLVPPPCAGSSAFARSLQESSSSVRQVPKDEAAAAQRERHLDEYFAQRKDFERQERHRQKQSFGLG